MEELNLLRPFWAWLAVVIGTSLMSLIGTWIVVKRSRLLK